MAISKTFGFYTGMQNSVSNISFTSNIRFVPYPKYREISDMGLFGTKFVEEMHDISKIRHITNRGATESIIYCLAGMVQNLKSKKHFLSHWFPKKIVKNNKICERNSKKLASKLNKISANNKFKGVFFGLISEDFIEENKMGKKLFKLFKDNFKIPNKKDYTLFLFQDAKGLKSTDDWPTINFVYSKKDDTYYVNCRKTIDKKIHDLLTKDEIRNHFGVILPSKNDKFFVGDEQVPNGFWTKFKKSDLVDLY